MYHVFLTDVAIGEGISIDDQLYGSHYLVILSTDDYAEAQAAALKVRAGLPVDCYAGIYGDSTCHYSKVVIESYWGLSC